jgi:hypothetical protein
MCPSGRDLLDERRPKMRRATGIRQQPSADQKFPVQLGGKQTLGGGPVKPGFYVGPHATPRKG